MEIYGERVGRTYPRERNVLTARESVKFANGSIPDRLTCPGITKYLPIKVGFNKYMDTF